MNLLFEVPETAPPPKLRPPRKRNVVPATEPVQETFGAVRQHVEKVTGQDLAKSYRQRYEESCREWPPEMIRIDSIHALFGAVLARGFDDARHLDMLICNDHEDDELYLEDGDDALETQMRGIRWIRDNGEDFEDICMMAGVDPVATRERYMDKLRLYKILRGNGTVDADYLGMSYGALHDEMKGSIE